MLISSGVFRLMIELRVVLGLGEKIGLAFLEFFTEFILALLVISGVFGKSCDLGLVDLGKLCPMMLLIISSSSKLSDSFSDILYVI